MTTAMVRGTEFTSVEHYDPQVMAKAYELYLNTDMSLTDIAIDLCIPAQVVSKWSKKGGWLERKRAITAELMHAAEDQYRKWLLEERLPTAKRHSELGRRLEERIGALVEKIENNEDLPRGADMVIKRLAEALSSSTGVSSRAVGISERPFSEANESEKQVKQPLVFIGVTPSAKPDAAPREARDAINVEVQAS